MPDASNNKLESKVETEPQQASEETTNERVGVLIDELKERTHELEEVNRELRRVSHYRSLFLARIEAGQTELFLQEFSMRETLRESCAAVARLAQKQQVKLEYDLAPEITTVVSDQGKLRQILFNFISWAVSRSPADQLVRVFVGLEEPQLYIQISDNGESLKDIAKVFDPEDTSSSPEANVNELGIIIGRRLIELLTGSVELRNLDSSGLEVTIKVPARPPKEPEPT